MPGLHDRRDCIGQRVELASILANPLPMRRSTRKRLYLLFLVAACLFSMWQLYALAKWRSEVATRHPGVPRPWADEIGAGSPLLRFSGY